MFADRTEAGRRLADALAARGVAADVVLAVPRGGLPVGRAVADRLGARLDVVVAKKLGAPGNPELAIGAVAADGSLWRNDDLVADLGISEEYVAEERRRQSAAAREKVESYRGGAPVPDIAGKRVVVVDDGVATGATAIACLRQVREAGAERVVFAVPVGPASAVEDLRGEADEVVVLQTPTPFRAVGSHYRSFAQVSDEEALAYLRG